MAKLSSWKRRHLSFGGHMVLLNLVMSAIPIFSFLFLKFLAQLLKVLSGSRKFFCGVELETAKKLHG
jgi:hypothetical protein